MHNWCVKGKLKPYGIGNRVYFKRSEIEANLVPLSVNTSGNGGNNG
ncbi:MAG TPA: helix-turn-helix domain-containing protein [Bacteroidia bacterium]|nr:helix-turn-helix domain-containing protein [Bacteroidia bacterium]